MRGGLSRSGSDLACGILGLAVGPCLAVLYRDSNSEKSPCGVVRLGLGLEHVK